MSIDLARIGQILKERREEKGLTVRQIAETLCLRKSLIEAIEGGDWGPLPHEVYVKGFVKEYAGLLRAQNEIADCLIEQPDKVVQITEVVTQPPPQPRPAKTVKTEAKPRKFFRARFAVVVLLGIVMFVFAYDRIDREKKVATKVETATKVAEQSGGEGQTNSVRAVSEVAGASESGSTIGEPKRLMITCHERTWISVVIDGKEKKEFMLSPQEIIVLNAKDKFDLLVGNAGGIKLLLNGKDTEFTGKSGEVKRMELS